MKKPLNLIIDTDPGVDDSIAIIPALFDKKLNILLFTTVAGNVNVDLTTRNLLHILERFNKTDIPVAKGAAKPLKREHKDATFIHGPDGTGQYKIKKQPVTKPIEKDAVEAMYETICKHKKDIKIALLAPQTNMANLLIKHPDVKDMISEIVFEGTSGYGMKKNTPVLNEKHISFNASSDPEALKIVLESGIPITIIPSEVGRTTQLHESDVLKIKENEVVGDLMYQMLNGYWEPNITPKVVSMNDACALLYLRDKYLFKTRRADVYLDVDDEPGKTIYKYRLRGKYKIVTSASLKRFHKYVNKKKF